MTVKIVIKRKVPRDREKELLPLIKELRILTTLGNRRGLEPLGKKSRKGRTAK